MAKLLISGSSVGFAAVFHGTYMPGKPIAALWLCLLVLYAPARATAPDDEFVCAGSLSAADIDETPRRAAKPVPRPISGRRGTVALFAQFRDEQPGWEQVPEWSADIFDLARPGSFSHFYAAMSFGAFQVRGEAAPRPYASLRSASAYLAAEPTEPGHYGIFVREILEQADRDIDFSRFDSDGPDGIPASGDDDGVVDALFVVLASTPARFLLGRATGIAGLQLGEPFVTGDRDADGKPIRIEEFQGTLQRGRTFAETVGSMCHEYGHLLGLPDLYDTGYLRKNDAPPEEDSAGIGAWGLMGWGALGWNGDDGPNSFCAWSRVKLGWATVVQLAREEEEMRLPDVGIRGAIYKIPIAANESFLLENRRAAGSFYDRHIPQDGLLVWHIGPSGQPRSHVDLECADGRWLDAGHPLGRQADSLRGGDNLDFWAHDAAYAESHGGNLGDATDPFDGVRFAAFTPETNPSAHSLAGGSSVWIEDIRIADGVARARIRTTPPRLEMSSLMVIDTNKDGLLAPGEEAIVRFRLANKGGVVGRNVRVRLRTGEPLVDVRVNEAEMGDLEVGHMSGVPRNETGFPRIALDREFAGTRELGLILTTFVDGAQVDEGRVTVKAVSIFRVTGRVTDAEGQGVADLAVWIYSNNGDSRSYPLHTDADGAFAEDLPPGDYTVQIGDSPKRGLSAYFSFFQVRDEVHLDIVLTPTFPVSGAVLDPEGTPVSGAQIRTGMIYSTASSGYGTYSLKLPRGSHTLTVEKRSNEPEQNFPPQTMDPIRVEGPLTMDLRLLRGVAVVVRAVDEEGNPARRTLFSVSSRSGYQSGKTDDKGVETMTLIPGLYSFLFHAYGPNADAFFYPLSVSADTTLQFVVPRGFTLSGRLVDQSVEPFFDGSLSLTPFTSGLQQTLTIGGTGQYRGQLRADRYQTVFISAGSGRSPSQYLDTIAVHGDAVRDLSIEEGIPVHGHILDEIGTGLDGVRITATSTTAGVSNSIDVQADGSFTLYLKPGAYDLIGAAGDAIFKPAAYDLIGAAGDAVFWNAGRVEVPSANPLELRRFAGASLSGTIRDDAGNPREGAVALLTRHPQTLIMPSSFASRRILHFGGSDFEAAAVTGERGAYTLKARPGTYDLLVYPSPYGETGMVIENIDLSEDRIRDLILPSPETTFQVFGAIHHRPATAHSPVVVQFLRPRHPRRRPGVFVRRVQPRPASGPLPGARRPHQPGGRLPEDLRPGRAGDRSRPALGHRPGIPGHRSAGTD